MRLFQQLLKPFKTWTSNETFRSRSTESPTVTPCAFPLIDASTHRDQDCEVDPSSEVRRCQLIFRSVIGPRVLISDSIAEFCTRVSESFVSHCALNQAELEGYAIVTGSRIDRSHVVGSTVIACILQDSIVCCGAELHKCSLKNTWVCGGNYKNCQMVRSGLVRCYRGYSTQRLAVVDHWSTEADLDEEVYASPEDEERTIEYWRTHRQPTL